MVRIDRSLGGRPLSPFEGNYEHVERRAELSAAVLRFVVDLALQHLRAIDVAARQQRDDVLRCRQYVRRLRTQLTMHQVRQVVSDVDERATGLERIQRVRHPSRATDGIGV